MPFISIETKVDGQKQRKTSYEQHTFGTCGLNSTARWMASTALISDGLNPRFAANSGENLY